ncbi:MAG TPA: glycerol-3-phosphate 1-O-acyltransferase PlsY [bacterium]|jgi:glycerol-3-phosphate acyltransferase PlsY|nr:glycerol-3-phosphate 1-O-acyltransferase PlsY [bacterium]
MISSIILSYLLGSIPTGAIAGKIKGRDITRLGSGNIGAANVARVLGTPVALAVFAGDLLKGLLAVHLGHWLGGTPAAAVMAGLVAACGHSWPLFLGFRGGKSVATLFGACLALSPWLALILIVIWVVVVAVTRYSSLGSIVGAGAAPFMAAILRQGWSIFWFGLAGAALIIVRHRANIERLLTGSELKLGDRF